LFYVTKLTAWERSLLENLIFAQLVKKSGTFYGIQSSERSSQDVGFEDFAVVVTKSTIFCDIMTCSPLKASQGFVGIYRLHLQGWRRLLLRNVG
jgi:hypothetical protein